NIYYVFTVDKEARKKGLQYSEVDMTLDGGLGDVKVKNTFIKAPVAEKLTAVQHENKTDIWVIAHEWESDVFLAYLVTENGVSTTPVTSKVGTKHTGNTLNTIGYLKVSSGGNKLASVIKSTSGAVEVFNFNNVTGVVSDALHLGNFGNPYGVEFSPDNTKLYISCYTKQELIQFDLTANAPALSQKLIHTSLNTISALQLAPDGKIYVSRNGSSKMGVIKDPNQEGVLCQYNDEGFSLGTKTCNAGLPTFIQSYFIPLTGFNYDAPCVEQSTGFYGISNVTPESWQWNFGDIGTPDNESTEQNPTHTFMKIGRYRVALVIGRGGIYDTVIKYLDVLPKPKPDLGKDMLRCMGEEVMLDAGAGTKFSWNTGDTTQTIKVTASGKYWVRVSNITCIGSDTVNITFLEKDEMMLGDDTTLCEGSAVKLESKIIGAKYLWNTGSRDSAIKVNKTGSYWLQISVGDCIVTDTVQVNFIPPPVIDLGKDSTVCEGDEVMLDAKNPGALYEWSTGENTQQITVKKGDTYWVKVYGGDCFAADTVTFYPCRATVIIPNAFSPNNNDSLNDYFHVFGTDIFNAKLTITNRWGEIIFQTNDIYKGWDGKFRGEKCPGGQYFWALYYWEHEGSILYPKEKKGPLYIMP
ncbi:MAG: T9SS type B sorting domain-containing protein, partial [Bacteroidia bacterium]